MISSFPGILQHLPGLKNDLRAAENHHKQLADAEVILVVQNRLEVERDWRLRSVAHRAD
jgi:hypothetical protein